MNRKHLRRTLGITCLAAAGFLAAPPGQASVRQPAAVPSMDALLTEVRGLRAELAQAAGASIRTQLLVARLQLQEQRINSVVQQLETIRQEISTIQQTRSAFAIQLKLYEEETRTAGMPPEEEKGTHPLKALDDAQQKRERELRDQETALVAQLASEQARWSEFSDRLDAVERELQVPVPR